MNWTDDRNQPQARVLLDSVSPEGVRLTTLEVTCHRFVLAEFNDEEADLARFRSRVTVQDDGCWQWSSVREDGYGTFTIDGVCHVPHRWLYERLVGPVPEVLDHLCRNRGCVNPAHVEPVTQAENIARAVDHRAQINAAKTHCKHGHEYTEDNTILRDYTVSSGEVRQNRSCRECARLQRAVRTERERAERGAA